MFRLGSALFLGVLVTGCGFRSSLETEDFELVSFVVDQPSYVQGETGFATATLRNLGASDSALPSVSIHSGGVAESFAYDGPDILVNGALLGDGDAIGPGETVILKWSFVSAEEAEPGAASAWVKLVDVSGQAASPTVAFELLRAATLEVTAISYVHPPEGGDGEPPSYACIAVRPTFVSVSVKNLGASAANVSEESLSVVGVSQDHFHDAAEDGNPASIQPGTTEIFHLEMGALAGAAPSAEYALAFSAIVSDATTGSTRPPPSHPEPLHLPFTVHRPAGLVLTITESATTVSTATPDVGTVSVQVQNTGTVEVRIDTISMRMLVGGDTTTDEYSFGTPTVTLPITLQPGAQLTQDAGVLLSAPVPTTGATVSQGLATATDFACEKTPSGNSENNSSEGDWLVQ